MEILFRVFLFILGACLGSFLCCQARRLRRRELKKKPLGSRSICPHCRYQLSWRDNLPIISWLALRGKCRKCHKKIGLAEILSELGLAAAFLLLSINFNVAMATPLDWAAFIATLIFAVVLAFLAIYDGLYGELPTLYLTISIICAIIMLVLKEWAILSISSFTPNFIYEPLLSITILGGIYLVLYLISKGKWVGDGDWLLGTAIAIALFSPWLALVALFLANFIACLVMYPVVKTRKNHHVHFGPFLVIAFIITYSFGNFLLNMI